MGNAIWCVSHGIFCADLNFYHEEFDFGIGNGKNPQKRCKKAGGRQIGPNVCKRMYKY